MKMKRFTDEQITYSLRQGARPRAAPWWPTCAPKLV